MLIEYLYSYFQDPDLKQIFLDVIGIDDLSKINSLIIESIERNFNFGINKILFIESSIGIVIGLLLSNHEQVIMKIYSPKISKDYLEKMNNIQNVFYNEQFPAPKILSPIFSINNTHAGFYELIVGEKQDAHQAIIREELARTLANFVIIVNQHKLPPLLNFFQQQSGRKLWPTLHNFMFNFERTSRGAGWIANKARIARKILAKDKSAKILSHTDWGTKNAIFKDNKLVGVFDWDSLGSMSELEMIGRASAQFTADWEKDFKVTPTPGEGRLFVKTYENYRGKKFTQDEYQIISAAADDLIAIIARFEHAGNNTSAHPYQDLLKECGDRSFLFV